MLAQLDDISAASFKCSHKVFVIGYMVKIADSEIAVHKIAFRRKADA